MCSVQGRYDIMRNYMPKVGSLGLDMMLRTCTVQVRWILWLCMASEFPSTVSYLETYRNCVTCILDRLIWILAQKLIWSGSSALALLCNLWEARALCGITRNFLLTILTNHCLNIIQIQQIATALFANSPFTEGKPNGFLSMRRFLDALIIIPKFILISVSLPGYNFGTFWQPYMDRHWQGPHRNATICFRWLLWVSIKLFIQ